MALIGFSTGALALQDFKRGLDLVRLHNLKAVELSALREPELEPLIASLSSLDLADFNYVSVHAPSSITKGNEAHVVASLSEAANRGWSIIVHPDVIADPSLWNQLGNALTLENNDRRKPVGQRCDDLFEWFEKCPDAGFCLDIGHARQVDRTMTEAYFMLKSFGERLRQLHISEVSAQSRHERLSYLSVQAIKQIAGLFPGEIPAIIESVVSECDIAAEIRAVKAALRCEESEHGRELGLGQINSLSVAPIKTSFI